MTVFRTYIIPAGIITGARAKINAAEVTNPDGSKTPLPGLAGMFTTPLSPTGTGNATHWASSGYMSQAEADFINEQVPKAFEQSDGTVEATDPQGVKSRVPEGPHEMFARAGLKIVRGTL